MTAADAERAARRGTAHPGWWVLLIALAFLTLESIVLAVTLQGRWLVLLAPGAVCAAKTMETWREIRRRMETGPADGG